MFFKLPVVAVAALSGALAVTWHRMIRESPGRSNVAMTRPGLSSRQAVGEWLAAIG